MPRYALKIEYHGGPFAGWQRQKGHLSVQQCVEGALAEINPSPPTVAAAGRTDAGVHATGQVAHCDLENEWTPFRLSEALNFHLKPQPIAVLAAQAVRGDFHARFSAVERIYRFRLLARRAPLTHERDLLWRVNYTLNAEAMREGAAYLIGKHDFTTFRSTACQAASPVKTIDEVSIDEIVRPDGIEYRFTFRARSFLHNQVRSLVGTLERVGAGAWTPDDVKSALEARDRMACGPVCPAAGLYLTGVRYPTVSF
ncbi:MAG: tRNA pseudouridine(38-40) synthase TruA [Pseudomonadota bacterium]